MAEFLSSPESEMSLADLVNRVLDRGAVISGEVVIGVGGVDLIYLGLRLVLSSAETMREHIAHDRREPGAP
jgi:gas vesicle structural protein